MGKSALAADIAFHVARNYSFEIQPDGTRKTVNGGVVAFYSLEMSAGQLGTRLLADISCVPSDMIRKGEIGGGVRQIPDAAADIQELPLFIDDAGDISVARLVARSRRLKRTSGLDLIVVGLLQLVTAGGGPKPDDPAQEVSIVARGLKALAKELRIPVLVVSQLPRRVERPHRQAAPIG